MRETQADAHGAFEFEVLRAEAGLSFLSNVVCLRVETDFGSGSSAWTEIRALTTAANLAPMRDWQAHPAVSEGGRLTFAPVIEVDDAPPILSDAGVWHLGLQLTHRAQVTTPDGGLLWREDDRSPLGEQFQFVRQALVLDDVKLEDFDAVLHLSASLFDPDQSPPSLGYFESQPATGMRAGETLSFRGHRVPFSRGLPCQELGTPCPLTDGDLSSVDGGLVPLVRLELPQHPVVSAIVFRGAATAKGVIGVDLVGGDGGVVMSALEAVPLSAFAFDDSQVPMPAFLVIGVDAGVPVSRVSLRFGGGLAEVQEVSVF